MEYREEEPEFGPGPLLAIAGRIGMVEDLAKGLPVEALLLELTHALAVDEGATADLGSLVHVGEHRVTSRRRSSECGRVIAIVCRASRVMPWMQPDPTVGHAASRRPVGAPR
jgi:hypothetical protein